MRPRLQFRVTAGTELRAGRADAAFADFDGRDGQRTSGVWIRNRPRSALDRRESWFVVEVMLKLEQAKEGINVVHLG